MKITMDTLEGALVLLAEATFPASANGSGYTPKSIREAVQTVATLESLERSLRQIAVNRCNGYSYGSGDWAQDLEDRDIRREERLLKRAGALVGVYGLELILGGDVRGSQVRIATPKTRRYNTMGGAESGWAL